MKNLVSKAKSLWSKVPSGAKSQGWHVALVFVITFAVTAAPAIPNLVSQVQLGQLPSFSALHALFAAAASAGLKAVIPVGRTLAVALVGKVVQKANERKAFKQAVQEFIAAKAAQVTTSPVA